MDSRSHIPIQGKGQPSAIRALLAKQFPHARWGVALRKPPGRLPTGIQALDAVLGGGLPRGAMTELIARGNGSGSTEVIHQVMRKAARNRQFLALVDGRGSLDVGAVEPAVLRWLLWLRCRAVAEVLKAADLLLRDRNFPLVLIDLKLNSPWELRRITASLWFRYARLLEQNGTTVLVVTPWALVGVATCRVIVESGLGFDLLGQPRSVVHSCLRFNPWRPVLEPNEIPVAQAG